MSVIWERLSPAGVPLPSRDVPGDSVIFAESLEVLMMIVSMSQGGSEAAGTDGFP